MAQLLLISEDSVSTNANWEVGDIVGVFDDSHVFSEHEKKIFDIVEYDDSKDVKSAKEQGFVEAREVYKTDAEDWSFDKKELVEATPEIKEVWKDGDDYKEIKKQPALIRRYEGGKILNNYSRYSENKTTTLISSLEAEK